MKDEKSRLTQLSAANIKAAKELISKLGKTTTNLISAEPIYDDVYFDGVAALNRMDSPDSEEN